MRTAIRQFRGADGTRFYAGLLAPLRGQRCIMRVLIGPLDGPLGVDLTRAVELPPDTIVDHDTALDRLAAASETTLFNLWRSP